MDFLLNRFSRDLASLIHWLDQLDRYGLQTKRAITVPLVREMMEQM
jgi:DnaA family protein